MAEYALHMLHSWSQVPGNEQRLNDCSHLVANAAFDVTNVRKVAPNAILLPAFTANSIFMGASQFWEEFRADLPDDILARQANGDLIYDGTFTMFPLILPSTENGEAMGLAIADRSWLHTDLTKHTYLDQSWEWFPPRLVTEFLKIPRFTEGRTTIQARIAIQSWWNAAVRTMIRTLISENVNVWSNCGGQIALHDDQPRLHACIEYPSAQDVCVIAAHSPGIAWFTDARIPETVIRGETL